MEANLVWTWLHSLQLESYTQAFLDNGYDDLEVCKQIGHPDLDAIGVDPGDNRDTLLAAVDRLAEQGVTDVYFLLEDPDYQDQKTTGTYDDCYEAVNWCRYPHTRVLLGDAVTSEDKDDYAQTQAQPQPRPQGKTSRRNDKIGHGCRLPSDLAEKYAVELGTSKEDVLAQLQHLSYCTSERQPQCNGVDTSDQHEQQPTAAPLYSIYSVQEDGAVGRPLLSGPALTMTYCHAREFCPEGLPETPPCSSLNDLTVSGVQVEKSSHRDGHDGVEVEDQDKKERSLDLTEGMKRTASHTLSRLLRRPTGSKKYTYRQFEGDLNASDITMSEQNRIELMLLVKRGKISPEDAVEMVKRYEEVKSEMSPLPHTSHDMIDSNLNLLSSIEDEQDDDDSGMSNGSASLFTSQSHLPTSQFIASCPSPSSLLHMSASRGMTSVRPDNPKVTKPFKFIRSPFSSPTKQPPLSSAKACDVTLAKEKRKFSFSSPFTRRKAATASGVKGLVDPDTAYLRGNSSKHRSVSEERQKSGRKDERSGKRKPRIPSNKDMPCKTELQTVDMFSVGSQTLERRIECHPTFADNHHMACRSVSPSNRWPVADVHSHLRKTSSQQLHMYPPGEHQTNQSPDQNCHRSVQTSSAQVGSDNDITPLGSSSTMSVGSESSPVLEARNGVNRSMRRPKMAYRRFSAGDCIVSSSDYDEDSSQSSVHTGAISRSDNPASFITSHVTNRPTKVKGHSKRHRPKPRNVEELLWRLSLQHLLGVFLHSGCDTLQAFAELESGNLDELGIRNAEDRTKVITAAQMLLDYDEESTDSTDVYSRASSSSQSPAGISSCDSAPHLTHDTAKISCKKRTQLSDTSIDDSTLTAGDKGIQNGCYYPDDVSTLTQQNQINRCGNCVHDSLSDENVGRI